MVSSRVFSTLFCRFLVALVAIAVFAACGGEDVDPIDGQDITTGDDVGIDAPDDTGGDTDTDPDPEEEVIECDRPLPTPPAGERCVVEPGTSDHILLRGTILAGDDIYKQGSVLLDDQSPNRQIQCTGCDCDEEAEAQEATVISCPDGVISPGLINPHDHLTFAEGRPQPHGEERFNHRHDWRRGLRDHSQLSTWPRDAGSAREGVLYGELRMLFGGSTSIAGSTGFSNASGLLRNLDQPMDNEGLDTGDVDYRTFPLGDGGFPALIADGCGYPNIDSESRLDDGTYLPHVAEGIDLEARNELVCLSGASGRNLIRENTSIIHGIAVNARDVAMIAEAGANLVWSPRTNIDLYGNTAPVTLYERYGVPISLGTDWSTSGSMNMLRELECADYLNRMHFNDTFTDAQIWKMATYNGAISLGAEHTIGLIEPGYVADITIFDGTSRSPYRAVIDADIDDISLVMRGGEPLYGDAQLIEGLVSEQNHDKCELIDVCERDRRACVELDTGMSIAEIQAGVHSESYPLFFCGEPEDEPTCVPSRPSEYDGIATPSDSSGDGIADSMDNCPDYFNPIRPMDGETQGNINGNEFGDVCDPCPISQDPECTEIDPNDWSGDGYTNDVDNCPFHYNPDQEDSSGDGIGDVCSPCPEHVISPGNPCPYSIYDIKTGEAGDGSPVAVNDALVTAVADVGLFVQVHPDDEGYEGADYSGLYIYTANAQSSDNAEPGDRIDVVGAVSDFFGQLQVASVDTLEVVSSGHALPDPVAADAEDVASGGSRQQQLEGVLIETQDLLVTDVDVAPGPGDSAPTNEFIVDNSLHINNLFYLVDPFPQVDDTIESITGILRWANGNSKLEPRSADDVIIGPPELEKFEPDTVYLDVADGSQPVLDLHLDRPGEAPIIVDLDYSDDTVVSGPASVVFSPGTEVVTLDLEALVADPDPVIVEATLDGLTVSATVRSYDDSTDRFLESLEGPSQAFFAGDTWTLEASLNVPAGSDSETIGLDISPDSDHVYPTELVLNSGERIAEFTIELGDDTGTYVAIADHDQTSESFAFEVFEPVETFVETFDNFSTSGSQYMDGSFVGDHGFSWDYLEARQASEGGSPESIDGTSMTLRNPTSSLSATGIEGGIGWFSVDLQQAFTGSGTRQVELFINGNSIATSTGFEGTGEVHEFIVDDIGVSGDFDIEIVPTTSNQITIDNLTWSSGAPIDPDDLEFPDAELSGFSPASSYLEVSGDAAPVLTLELAGPALAQTTVDIWYEDEAAIDGPDTVTFEPGDISATLDLQALESRLDPVAIEATHDGTTVSADVHPFDDTTARNIDAFSTCQSALIDEPLGFEVEIDVPAGQSGLALDVTVDPDSQLSSPADDVSIAEGQSSAQFELTFVQQGSVDVTISTADDSTTVTVDVVDAQAPFVEDFSELPSISSYSDGNFVGNQGFEWFYEYAQRTFSWAIDDTSLLFGDSTSSISISDVPGGVSSFDVDMMKAFSSSDDRQLELFINGDSVATSQVIGDFSGEDYTVHTFSTDNLDTACVDSLEIRSIGSGQVSIDHLTWTPAGP